MEFCLSQGMGLMSILPAVMRYVAFRPQAQNAAPKGGQYALHCLLNCQTTPIQWLYFCRLCANVTNERNFMNVALSAVPII